MRTNWVKRLDAVEQSLGDFPPDCDSGYRELGREVLSVIKSIERAGVGSVNLAVWARARDLLSHIEVERTTHQ